MESQKHENPMSIRSKAALSKALLSLMMTRKFEEITISDIAAEAGLARQTFYTNFSKKEDILIYLLSEFFRRYHTQILASPEFPENIIVHYFIFWNDQRDFLRLLFKQNLGYLFCEQNRNFFTKNLSAFEKHFTADPWLLPYSLAGLAGMTFELLHLWITKEQGLDISVLHTLASNFISGRIFMPGENEAFSFPKVANS